ncbi:hypothetical protein LWE61_11520 [Sphingobium sufflavum]|uniref:hypothetical protein n=1 Tax=Sphingobium sufflavum TaxID=1129547 RepID=UPI001F2EE409|nr:hypothetical protein [Sphingobium sufflavum]MCE7797187.1 hypothetical protein [Sphingobium sufflavum]
MKFSWNFRDLVVFPPCLWEDEMPQTQRQTDRTPAPPPATQSAGHRTKSAHEKSRLDASEFWRRLGL